jgi:hypothetical protein
MPFVVVVAVARILGSGRPCHVVNVAVILTADFAATTYSGLVQSSHPSPPRVRRLLMAALFSAMSATSETFKIVAGFGQHPDFSEVGSLVVVASLAALLGWITAPALSQGPSKKIAQN